MGFYDGVHASALADVTEAGVSVTFTCTTSDSYDPETETETPTTTTIGGKAVRVTARSAADQEAYRGLGLVAGEAPTLLFVPTTEGDVPSVGDTVVWASERLTVRSVAPIAPDGTVRAARVIVGR